jgi:hypothetical protein
VDINSSTDAEALMNFQMIGETIRCRDRLLAIDAVRPTNSIDSRRRRRPSNEDSKPAVASASLVQVSVSSTEVGS